jgi:endonuclease/exonuclease/phosphatase family metal-dependent hydrolase
VSASADQSQPSRTFTIASLNLAGQPRIAEALEAWTQAREIDILLLQEVGHRSLDGEAFVATLSERLQFHSVYAPANPIGDTHTQGLAIVSRYPLDHVRVLPLTYHHLRFRSRCRIALVATMAMPAGPVHLVNLHLDTRINSKDRLAQLAPVLEAVDSKVPQLIGGDFNTMNIRWFRTMWPLVFLQRQVAAVEARDGVRRISHPVQGRSGDVQVSPSSDQIGLAVLEAFGAARVGRGHDPADRSSAACGLVSVSSSHTTERDPECVSTH